MQSAAAACVLASLFEAALSSPATAQTATDQTTASQTTVDVTTADQTAAGPATSGMSARLAASAASFALGGYLGNPDGGNAANEALFEKRYTSFSQKLKAKPEYIDAFLDYTQPVSAWPSNASWQAWSNAQSPKAKSMKPVIAFPLASIASGSASPDQQFQAFASGANDSAIQGVVQAWTAYGFKTLTIRLGWEMNLAGNTYAGDSSQDHADWIAAYRHTYKVVHAAAKAAGATVRVLWNPGVSNYDLVKATTMLYPGDGYVDAVAADMYSDLHPFSESSGVLTYHDWHTGGEDTSIAQFIADPVNRMHYWSHPAATVWSLDSSQGHSQSFLSLLHFAEEHNKPFAIPETGAGNSGNGTDVADDAAFPKWLWQQLSSAMNAGETILFVSVWNSDGGGNYAFSEAADGKPHEAAAWGTYTGATSRDAKK